jgi:pyrroline-5-carboxylate reductase
MIKIGFIGYGSMGRMLVKGLIQSGRVAQEQIFVTRKDKSRLEEIKKDWPDIHTAADVSDIVKNADYLFLCVKPLEFKKLLEEIGPMLRRDKNIISIAGSVMISDLEAITDCGITKIMPTVISEVNQGITLVCHNGRVSREAAGFIKSLIGSFSEVRIVQEKKFGFLSELTSCGPGLIAAIFKEYMAAGLRHTDSFRKEEIEEMLLKTMRGTAVLMLEENLSFDDVIGKVATKGGITEEGVKILQSGLPRALDEMFDQTLKKRMTVTEKVLAQFGNADI